MKYSFLVGLVGVVGLVVACGDTHHATAIPGEGGTTMGGTPAGVSGKHTGGSNTAGGTENMGGDQSMGGEPAVGGLTVTISSPTAATDPNKDEVIVADDVTVVCSVVATDANIKVDGSTVKLGVLDAEGKPALGQDSKPLEAKGEPTGAANEYSATFSMTTVPTGVVSFRCSGASTDKSASGSATVDTFMDHGPTIVVTTPAPGSPQALKDIMKMEFSVTPTLLTPDDMGAEVTSVTLYVAGVKIDKDTITVGDPQPGAYSTEINFNDQTVFTDQPPEHTSIRIEAVNSRAPKPVTAVDDYPIVVDGKGPVITITKPKQNQTVHGLTTIEFTATDSGAGLDIDTLELSLPGMAKPDKYDASRKTTWGHPQADTFTYTFDSTSSDLKAILAQINVSIHASDLAQNDGTAATLTLYKDDFPPIIDLDPGLARVEDPLQNICSAVFDPLGTALNDLTTTLVAANRFRVLVYDQTNFQAGLPYVYISGANPDKANLYLQADPSQPFLVDRDKDGICDDVAKEDFPYKSIAPVRPGGNVQYSKTDDATPPALGTCGVKDPTTPPKGLCADQKSDLTYVVKHRIATGTGEPVVYATGAAAGTFVEPQCTGDTWDLHPHTSKVDNGNLVPISADGWVCLAARVSDRLDNRAVSRPLRICLDDPDVPGVPACVTGAPPPSCTTDCTAPAAMPPHIYY
jgi:hypothetical protein